MTESEQEWIETNASRPPRLLGGPAAREGGVTEPCDEEVVSTLAELGRSGRWRAYMGRGHESLTARLAAGHGIRHCVLCSSGTVAVELALRGLGIGPGDEVLMAAYDFRGNFGNVCLVGATPVLVDIRAGDGQLDVASLEDAITPQTKAVIASHLHGGMADMPRLRRIADERGFALLEDACQAPGARIGGRIAGAWGDVSVMSFGGSKLLSAGRGGAVLTGRDDVAQRIRLYSHRGNDAYPLSEMQAAVLLPQWNAIDRTNARRGAAAGRLCRWLRDFGVDALVPWQTEFDKVALYRLAFWYDPRRCGGLTRDQFSAAAVAEGVPLHAGFRALHLSHARRRFRAPGSLPHAARADGELMTLHHSALSGDDRTLAAVAAGIVKIHRHAASLLSLPAVSSELRLD